MIYTLAQIDIDRDHHLLLQSHVEVKHSVIRLGLKFSVFSNFFLHLDLLLVHFKSLHHNYSTLNLMIKLDQLFNKSCNNLLYIDMWFPGIRYTIKKNK